MPTLLIEGPLGPLEAQLDFPEGAPATPPLAAVLLCHPHPPSGGTMNTHAVFRAMRAWRSLGCVILRFNFRGVGRSTGPLGDGEGERDDARAALAWLTARQPGLPLIAGGFSFCAWVGMTVGVEAHAQGLLGLGAPYDRYPFRPVAEADVPKAFVLAERDEFTAAPTFSAEVAAMRPPARLWVVAGTSHLFTEDLDSYEDRVRDAARWLLRSVKKTE